MKPRCIFRAFEGVLIGVIVVLFAGVALSALSQVVSRYVFNRPFMWTEEMARYLGTWCTMLTSGILLGRNLHLSIDYFVEKMDAVPQTALRAVVYLCSIVFSAVLVVYGIKLLFQVNTALSPALRIPMGYIYLSVPLGSFILLLYAVKGFMASISVITRSDRTKGSNRGNT